MEVELTVAVAKATELIKLQDLQGKMSQCQKGKKERKEGRKRKDEADKNFALDSWFPFPREE